MDFGFTLKPDPSTERLVSLTRQAEAAGFAYGWLFDSHVLWQEVYPLLTLMALNTPSMRLGTCVTNPATREPTVLASSYATLHDLSDGRMAMGVGRGDSAVRYVGRQPMKVAEYERACAMVRDFMNGREVHWNDKELQLKWVRPELPRIPMWIAGYGPNADAPRERRHADVPHPLRGNQAQRRFHDLFPPDFGIELFKGHGSLLCELSFTYYALLRNVSREKERNFQFWLTCL